MADNAKCGGVSSLVWDNSRRPPGGSHCLLPSHMELESQSKVEGWLFLNLRRHAIGHLLGAMNCDWFSRMWRQSVKGDAWRAPLASSISILICVRERREYVGPLRPKT